MCAVLSRLAPVKELENLKTEIGKKNHTHNRWGDQKLLGD